MDSCSGMAKRLQQFRQTLLDFLKIRLWDVDVTQMPPLRAFAVRQLRVGVIFVKGFTAGRIQLRASALTFTTLLSLGPVLVLALSIVQVMGAIPGIQSRLENFLLDNLSAGTLDQVRGWLYKFFDSVRSGAFRGLSLMVLVGGVLGLMGSLEQAFNDIWGVHRGRPLFQRFSVYTTLVVFGPVLIGLSLSLTASVETSALRVWLDSLSPGIRSLTAVGAKLLPALFTGIAFTLLYTVMPNVRVRLRASLPAGLIAGALWEGLKFGYTAWIHSASHYGTLYGSLAAVPLFMIWVYVSWIVVLFGAQLAFARDAAHDLRLEEGAINASLRERIRVALHLALATSRNYRNEAPPPELIRLAHRLHLPLRLVRFGAEDLVDGGILHLVARERREPGLVPARPIDRITVYDIISCLMDRGAPTASTEPGVAAAAPVDILMEQLDESLRERWEGLSLSDLLDEQDRQGNQEVLPFPGLWSRSQGPYPGPEGGI